MPQFVQNVFLVEIGAIVKIHPDGALKIPGKSPVRKKPNETLNADDENAALYDQLCAIENKSKHPSHQRPIEHHVLEGKWVERP